jgi:hypothetical protein
MSTEELAGMFPPSMKDVPYVRAPTEDDLISWALAVDFDNPA